MASGAGLQIMMLKPDTPESKLLVDWVEGGIIRHYIPCPAAIPAPDTAAAMP